MDEMRGRLVARRSRPLADIVVWICLVGLGIALLSLANFGGSPSALDTGGHLLVQIRRLGSIPEVATAYADGIEAVPPVWVFAAGLILILVVGLWTRGVHQLIGWWSLQALSACLGAAWTISLVLIGRPDSSALNAAGPPLGRAIATGLAELTPGRAVFGTLLVGLLAGVAVGLLNAGVQSLCGEVQARRFAAVAVVTPTAAWYAESATVAILVLSLATLTVSAMASERGRGATWTLGLGAVAGLLLGSAVLTAYESSAVGIGMLCIYFLRRRPMMILISGLSLAAVLVIAALSGWSWSGGFDSVAGLDGLARLGPHVAGVVTGIVVIAALAGPIVATSWRKVRNTPAWPFMLTAVSALAFLLLIRVHSGTWISAMTPWSALLAVAAVAPLRQADSPQGPDGAVLGVSGAFGIVLTFLLASA